MGVLHAWLRTFLLDIRRCWSQHCSSTGNTQTVSVQLSQSADASLKWHVWSLSHLFWWARTKLVDKLVRVSIQPLLWWHGYFVQVPTVLPALAWADEHDGFVHAASFRALEGHRDGAGVSGGTTPAVGANATVVRLVSADAAAAGVAQVNGFWRLVGTSALLSFLEGKQKKVEEGKRERVGKRMRWNKQNTMTKLPQKLLNFIIILSFIFCKHLIHPGVGAYPAPGRQPTAVRCISSGQNLRFSLF